MHPLGPFFHALVLLLKSLENRIASLPLLPTAETQKLGPDHREKRDLIESLSEIIVSWTKQKQYPDFVIKSDNKLYHMTRTGLRALSHGARTSLRSVRTP